MSISIKKFIHNLSVELYNDRMDCMKNSMYKTPFYLL